MLDRDHFLKMSHKLPLFGALLYDYGHLPLYLEASISFFRTCIVIFLHGTWSSG